MTLASIMLWLFNSFCGFYICVEAIAFCAVALAVVFVVSVFLQVFLFLQYGRRELWLWFELGYINASTLWPDAGHTI